MLLWCPSSHHGERCVSPHIPKIKQATETETQAEEKKERQRVNPEHGAGWKLQKKAKTKRKERMNKQENREGLQDRRKKERKLRKMVASRGGNHEVLRAVL